MMRHPWGVQADDELHQKLEAYQIEHGLSKSQTLRVLLAHALGYPPSEAWMLAYREGLDIGRAEGIKPFFQAHPRT